MSLNSDALALYKDIDTSEKILNKVSDVVSGFQGELERISGEVRTLQARSESYNLQHKRNL